MPKKSIQLQAGQKFNRLTVIKLDHIQEYISPKLAKHNKEYYLCKCDCGNECVISKQSLLQKHTKSCGCLPNCKIKHGFSKTKIYKIYKSIKYRCFNKNNTSYKNYGGRGIIMCDDWKKDFIVFYNWAMDNGYKENKGINLLTIDRIDNNGNYEPSNCRWATNKEQSRNKRNNHLITYNNETHCIKDWASIIGIKYYTLINRINKYNWSPEKSFNTPVKIYIKHKTG